MRHEEFLGNLTASERAVNAVADWLRDRGRIVGVPPLRLAPTRAEAKDYSDGGDMFVDGHRVEVKQVKKRTFTGAKDWPFSEFYIDDEDKVLTEGVKAYIRVNLQLTHVGIVTFSSREHWYVKLIRKANYPVQKIRVFACPVWCVRFMRIAP